MTEIAVLLVGYERIKDTKMQTLYQYLRSKGLASRNGVRQESVQKLTHIKMENVARELDGICLEKAGRRRIPTFKHFASLALGGSREECAALECRQKRLDALSRFSIMYSDKVFIKSFITDICNSGSTPIDILRQGFCDDLQLLWLIRPLIESGDVGFIPSFGCICRNCMCEQFGVDLGQQKRLDGLYIKLANDFLGETSLKIQQIDKGIFWVEQRGPESYFPHGFQGEILYELPKPLGRRPNILKKLLRDREITASHTLQKELGAHRKMAGSVVNNILYGLIAANSYEAPLLTHNPLHISCLNELSGDVNLVDRNNIAFEVLTSHVPFLPDISLKNLLKLRSREKECFILYRAALNRTINEFKSSGSGFTKHTAKELYGDVLAPELARMDRKIKQAAKDLRTTARRAVVSTVGAISFGLYAGVINPSVAPIVTGIGLAKVASDIVKVMAIGDGEKAIANEGMYFLWKTKQLAGK